MKKFFCVLGSIVAIAVAGKVGMTYGVIKEQEKIEKEKKAKELEAGKK